MTSQPRSEHSFEDQSSSPYNSIQFERDLRAIGSYLLEGIALDVDGKLIDSLLSRISSMRPPFELDDASFSRLISHLAGKTDTPVKNRLMPFLIPFPDLLNLDGMALPIYTLSSTENEAWSSCINLPISSLRVPCPDFSVGFSAHAFDAAVCVKLLENIDQAQTGSPVAATMGCFFPFFTCEVKSANTPLAVAERQNAHSMTIALKGVMTLFQAASMDSDLDKRMLGFSMVYNNAEARIYGHFTDFIGARVQYHRTKISTMSLLDNRDRHKPYQFLMNVYEVWAPMHLDRIREALDKVDISLLGKYSSFDGKRLHAAANSASTSKDLDAGNTPVQDAVN